MNDTFTNFLNFVESWVWADYSLILLLIGFAILGFKHGFALGLIHFIWLIAAGVFAISGYDMLSNNVSFWLFNGHDFISFISLFVLFLLSKLGLYKLFKTIAEIRGPCPLNRFLAFFISISMAFGISWVLADNTTHIDLVSRLITHEELRFTFAFILIFSAICITAFVLIKMLNIQVGIDHPCPLLVALRPIDSMLNAKHINSFSNRLFGVPLGLFKGFITMVLLMVVLHQFDQTLYGSLINLLNPIVANTQNVLADYLTFIKP